MSLTEGMKQMIDVNWDLAPEGAVELVQYGNRVTWRKGIKIWCYTQEGWYDYVSDWKTITKRPTQTKTVEDNIIHKDGYGTHFVGKKKTVTNAVEQEGEKWTHIHSGVECRIKIDSPDCDGYLVVITKAGRYLFCKLGELKPIKPTLSSKDYKLLANYAQYLNCTPAEFEQYISENYHVTN